jgi:hypothetical protein
MLVGQFSYKFEELPLLQLGPRLVGGLVDGTALIEFEDPSGDWVIRRIWLEVAYLPKIGEKGRVETVELSATPNMDWLDSYFYVVKQRLFADHEELIDETVRRALRGEVVS